MDSFYSLRVKKNTAVRFRTFARMYFKTQTLALDGMLDFFKYNEFSPHDRLGRRMGVVLDYLKDLKVFLGKRNNATIAIIRDMEKHGVLPTKAMMELLFEGGPKSKDDDVEDLQFPELDTVDFDAEFKLIDERKLRKDAELELSRTKERFRELVLEKVIVVRPSLCKPRLQLDMDLKEFEQLKALYKTE